jgi:integrase
MGLTSSLLRAAQLDGLIASNPVQGVRRPRVERRPVIPLTGAEVEALRAAAPAWFRVALDLAWGAGLRQAEATALTVDRVDWLRQQLRVDRQLMAVSAGEPCFGPPKTQRSFRTVPLADAVVQALAYHLELHGAGSDKLLVHLPDGTPIRRNRFGALWRALRNEAGLPTARFHDLRHSYASELLAGGVSVAATAELLGHSASECLRTYAHLVPADHDRARAVVQALMERSEPPRVTSVSGRGAGPRDHRR